MTASEELTRRFDAMADRKATIRPCATALGLELLDCEVVAQ